MVYNKTKEPVIWETFGNQSRAEDKNINVFAQLGTSYQANSWLYCRTDASWFNAPPGSYRPSNKPHMAVASPSRLIMVMDAGACAAGRYTETERTNMNNESGTCRGIVVGWWHG
jgi:hypothetical protein